MIEILVIDNILILKYGTENPWALNELERFKEVPLRKKTFIFLKEDILKFKDNDGEEIDFILGKINENRYFQIEGRKLGIKQNVYIHEDIKISDKFFVGVRSHSIFQEIGKIVSEDIYIGGNHVDSIPIKEFIDLLKEFPSIYEINKYIDSRMSAVLENYFGSAAKVRGKYEHYINKKKSIQGEKLPEALKENELLKYEAISEKLEQMLIDENKYNEKQWQIEILEIIRLLYPKYIYVFEEAPVWDSYKEKSRRIDFLLVDANGNVDLIEIKRPMSEKIITQTQYRDNHIPLKELSGTIMQIEKYIFYLNKSGKSGEDKLTKKYQSKIPVDFKIKITNPGGMIIMGRDIDLSPEQKEDFEVVKRKYKNVIDIITYDDLLRRLKFIIASWKNKH